MRFILSIVTCLCMGMFALFGQPPCTSTVSIQTMPYMHSLDAALLPPAAHVVILLTACFHAHSRHSSVAFFTSFLPALVNKGNCSFVLEDYEKAREHYMDALSIESSCIEALFNLGKSASVPWQNLL